MKRPVIDPRRHDAVLFELDGVVADTAALHVAIWRDVLEGALSRRAQVGAGDHSPFAADDYRRYLEGRTCFDAVAAFLASRGIELPWGSPVDSSDRDSVCGLGNQWNHLLHSRLAADGVRVFESTIDLARRLRGAGLGTAVFSSDRDCGQILDAAGIGDLFAVRADEVGPRGKPEPDIPMEAARRLGGRPARCVVVENADNGVRTGRHGGLRVQAGR